MLQKEMSSELGDYQPAAATCLILRFVPPPILAQPYVYSLFSSAAAAYSNALFAERNLSELSAGQHSELSAGITLT